MAYGGGSGSGSGSKNALDSFYSAGRKASTKAKKKKSGGGPKGWLGSLTDPLGVTTAIKDTASGIATLAAGAGEGVGYGVQKTINSVTGTNKKIKTPILDRITTGGVTAAGEFGGDIGDVVSGNMIKRHIKDIPVYGPVESKILDLNPLALPSRMGAKNSRNLAKAIGGSDVHPRTFEERANERGLASPIVQDVGLYAGGAGAVKGLLKGAARAGETVAAARGAGAAAEAGASAGDLGAIRGLVEQGGRGQADAVYGRTAVDEALKAPDPRRPSVADAGRPPVPGEKAARFAAKAREMANSDTLHNMEHPYRAIGRRLRPLFRASSDAVSGAKSVGEVAAEGGAAASGLDTTGAQYDEWATGQRERRTAERVIPEIPKDAPEGSHYVLKEVDPTTGEARPTSLTPQNPQGFDLGTDADLAERAYQSDASRRANVRLDIEAPDGTVIHEGKVRARPEATFVGDEVPDPVYTISGPDGPQLRTKNKTEMEKWVDAGRTKGEQLTVEITPDPRSVAGPSPTGAERRQGMPVDELAARRAQKTGEQVLTGPATWHGPEGDVPVNVTGEAGQGADGKVYVNVEGSNTAVDYQQIRFDAPDAGNTNVAADADVAGREAQQEPTLAQQYAKYAQQKGIEVSPQAVDPSIRLTPEARAQIADAYDSMPDDPNAPVAPEAVASYMSLHNDTRTTYDFITAPKDQGGMGVTVEFHAGDHDYTTPQELQQDLANGHLWVRGTHMAGDSPSTLMAQPEPDLVMPDGSEGTINDKFRAVHDVLAHSDFGNGFGRGGEEQAFQNHVQTVSPASRPALAMETRGQNSSMIESGGVQPPQRVGVLPAGMDDPVWGIGRTADEPPAGLSAVEREEWLDQRIIRDKIKSLTPSEEHTARLNRLAATAGPDGRRIIAAANEQIPQWAVDMAGRFGPRTLKAFDRFEGLIQGMETRRIMAEQRRFAEAARRRALHTGPVRSAIEAGRRLIETHAGVSRNEAEALVHQYVERHGTGTGDILEGALGVPEEVLGKVGVAGYKKIIPPEWLVDEAGNPTPLKIQLDDAVQQYRSLEQQAYDTLTGTRVGEKGLEAANSNDPRLSTADMRKIKQAQNLLKRASKLKGGQVARDIAAHRAKIAAAEDEVAALGTQLKTNEARVNAVLDDIDNATGYVPPAFKGEGWAPLTEEMARMALPAEMGGDEGFTFNPHTGEFIQGATEAGRFSVGAVPDTAVVMDAAEFAQRGPQVIDQVARAYLDLFRRDDIMMGGWAQDGKVYIDPAQLFKNRDEAILAAQARGQISMWDFEEAAKGNYGKADVTIPRSDRPDIAARLLKSKARARYARGARRVALDQATRLERVGLNPETANITPEHIDQHMSLMDTHAVQATDAGRYASPDEFYQHVAIESRFRPPASPGVALAQTFLNRKVNPQLWDEVQTHVKDLDKAMQWYYESHNAIEKRFRGKTVTLADGVTKVDAADLMYDLIAVTSINAAPNTNLGNALFALDNLNKHLAGGETAMKEAANALDEFFRRKPKQRSADELFHILTENSHMYTVGKKAVFEILSGRTIDTWDAEYLRGRNADFWGGNRKALSMKNVPRELVDELGPERAMIEHHGSDAWAKILSFRENLRDPAGSNAVTLDAWMARLFGINNDGGWGSKGDYAKFSRAVRDLAGEVSARLGRDVRPHEIQAALWVYAKREVSHQNVGRFLAAYQDTITQVNEGNYTPTSTIVMGAKGGDPIADYILEDLLPAREQAKKGAPSQILANAKNRVAKTTRFNGVDEDTGLSRKQAQDIIEANAKVKPDTKKFQLRERKVDIIRPEPGGKVTPEGVTAGEGVRGTETQTFQPDYLPKKLDKLEGQWADYQGLRADIYKALAEGDTDTVKNILAKYANERTRQIRDEAAGSFEDIIADPTKKVAEALTEMQKNGPETLLAQMGDEIMGTTEYLPQSDKWLMTMYRNADFTTLVHEQAHVMRQMLPDAQMAAIAKAYGVVGIAGEWSRAQEEKFANEFVAYLSGAEAPTGLAGAFNATRDALQAHAESGMQVLAPRHITPESQAFFDSFLEPKVTDVAEADVIPAFKDTAPLTPGQKVARTQPFPNETRTQTLRRGIRAGKSQERLRSLAADRAQVMARRTRVQASVDSMKATLHEERLPSQVLAATLDGRAYKSLEGVIDNVEDPSVGSVPAHWQPLWAGVKALQQAAEIDDNMAAVMGEIADVTFPDVIRIAKEQGFNPAHISMMRPHQVRALINEALRLGPDIGKEAESSTRKNRAYVVNGVEHSIRALGAGLVAAIKEKHTNAVVDYVEEVFARPVERSADGTMAIPQGWTAWDPVRRALTVGKEDVKLDNGLIGNDVQAARYMVPDAVARTIRAQSRDFNHPIFKALGKPTSLWRTFVLTLSPRWYVNNFVGNVALATAEGVRMTDWVKAWKSYRQREGGSFRGPRTDVPFADVPEVKGASFVSDLNGGGSSIIPRSPLIKGIREAMREGGVEGRVKGLREATHQAADVMRRGNEVVDEFARAAVYFKTLRTTGDHLAAVERSFKAMVDYHDLSPFEQAFVRSVVPFYSWQKGILKIAGKLMFDNPAAMALGLQLAQVNRDLQKDRYGTELPEAYSSFVQITGGGALNTRGVNPFQDSAGLLTPDGIGQSMNPFVEAAIRNALHASDVKWGNRQSVSPFGTVQSEVPLGQSLSDIATGVPQARLGADPSGSGFLRAAGVPYYTPQKVADIAQRTAEARAVVEAANDKKKNKGGKKTKRAGIFGSGSGNKSGSIYDNKKTGGGYTG